MNEVICKTPAELINAIAPNTVIRLIAPEYNLTGISMDYDENLYFRELSTPDDDRELVFARIENLHIIGDNPEGVRICTSYYWANVLCFERCKNIRLSSISIGHFPKAGGCTGGVLAFSECEDVQLNSVTMFGCGTEGLNVVDSSCFNITDCCIRECNYRILSLSNARDIMLRNCEFVDNDASLLEMRHTNNVSFHQCVYRDNTPCGFGDIDEDGNVYYLVTRDSSGELVIDDFALNDGNSGSGIYTGQITLTYKR